MTLQAEDAVYTFFYSSVILIGGYLLITEPLSIISSITTKLIQLSGALMILSGSLGLVSTYIRLR